MLSRARSVGRVETAAWQAALRYASLEFILSEVEGLGTQGWRVLISI